MVPLTDVRCNQVAELPTIRSQVEAWSQLS